MSSLTHNEFSFTRMTGSETPFDAKTEWKCAGWDSDFWKMVALARSDAATSNVYKRYTFAHPDQ
ncbi:hypothetical protein BRC68_00580 [Halobacteriales archaeon QH_6_64_20]|nr:MAG: hypothetical protein BRC68_00580 [Halobacteriales archaeon QH_6_64_20]